MTTATAAAPAAPTRDERAARGRAARTALPRGALADPGTRPPGTDPVALLVEQGRTRVPELLPLRYGRMSASPFGFYRGSALIMARDLATGPGTGLQVQLCGDAHLANFGLYASPERHLLFDVNDFDETATGPFEWDVQRLVASVELAARHTGVRRAARHELLTSTARTYRQAVAELAGRRTIEVWYAHPDVERLVAEYAAPAGRRAERQARGAVDKALRRDHLSALARLTRVRDGERRFVSDPPLLTTVHDLLDPADAATFTAGMRDLLRSYRRTLPSDRRHLLDRYRLVDLARKVVGVGSVGTRAFVLLMQGDDADDALVLQAKEAQASVLDTARGIVRRGQHGRRVVEGQRLMQSASDMLLGWQRTAGLDGVARDYYVRQLRDWKGSATVDTMRPEGLAAYARVCAWTLARAHARSGDRVAIASYLGTGDRADLAFADFATAYADRAEHDHGLLVAAVAAGRVPSETG
jgi:uncharacterized protein (DUF2252 family)